MIFSTILVSAQTKKQTISGENRYNTYILEWNYDREVPVITKIKEGTTCYEYTYNNSGYRTSKNVNGIITYFEYDKEGYLLSEYTGEHRVEYFYEEGWAHRFVVGCSIDGVNYDFEKDESTNNIIGLINANGERCVKFEYNQTLLLAKVYGRENGKWINKIDDVSFYGNLVHLLLEGLYYDVETKLYYYYGSYFDSTKEQFLMSSYTAETSVNIEKSKETRDIISDLYDDAIILKNDLLKSSDYGRSISYKSSWYSELDTVEILARLIYGECYNIEDQMKAVSWVLAYRKANVGFGNTLRAVATKSGQFATISGNASNTAKARTPDQKSSQWAYATELACLLIKSDGNINIYSGMISRPSGYTDQCYFVSHNYFINHSKNINLTNNTGEYTFDGSNYVAIKNIATKIGYYNGNDAKLNTFFNTAS